MAKSAATYTVKSSSSISSAAISNSDSSPVSRSSTNPTSRSSSNTSNVNRNDISKYFVKKPQQANSPLAGALKSLKAPPSAQASMEEGKSMKNPYKPLSAEGRRSWMALQITAKLDPEKRKIMEARAAQGKAAEASKKATEAAELAQEEEPLLSHTYTSSPQSGSQARAAASDSPEVVVGSEATQSSPVSERTLHESMNRKFDMEWELSPAKKKASKSRAVSNNAAKQQHQSSRANSSHDAALQRRQSSRFGDTLQKATATVSVLGKRSRDAFEAGKDKIKELRDIRRKKEARKRLTEGERLLLEEDEKRQAFEKHKEKTTLHLNDRMTLEELEEIERQAKLPHGWSLNVPEDEMREFKRRRLEEKHGSAADVEMDDAEVVVKQEVTKPTISKPKRKTYLKQGLYVGQKRGHNPKLKPSENLKKLAKLGDAADEEKANTTLPMVMYFGEDLLKRGRDFKVPYDIFSPSLPGGEKPPSWKQINKNRFYGDASSIWQKKQMNHSLCMCTPGYGCDDNCLNRIMHYECNEDLCAVGPEHCSNRAFNDLKVRYEKGSKYEKGIEVRQYPNKGFGVRACRSFKDDQIILEYCGEIITEEECQRRMNDEYKDSTNFYLMEFEQGMIIDATNGSAARFVNHSCNPNCEMRKAIVNNQPRMALFAARDIDTGEELTYDYNFQPNRDPQPCHCGASNCRGSIGPRATKVQEKKKAKEVEKKGSELKEAKKVGRSVTKTAIEEVKKAAKEVDKPAAKSSKEKAKQADKPTPKPVEGLEKGKVVEKAVQEEPKEEVRQEPRSSVGAVFFGMKTKAQRSGSRDASDLLQKVKDGRVTKAKNGLQRLFGGQ